MKHRQLYFFVTVIVFGMSCAGGLGYFRSEPPLFVPSEEPVPGVHEVITSSDYWIRMAGNPDELLLTAAEIDSCNARIREQRMLLADILGMPEQIAGSSFREYIAANSQYLENTQFYVTEAIPLEQVEQARIIARMDTFGIPDTISPQFGLTLHQVSGKNWPTDILLMQESGENEFDRNMVALVDMATPVALIHTSRDGRWVFVQTPRFFCWLPSRAVVFGTREVVGSFVAPSTPLVAIGDNVTVFSSPLSPVALGSLGMGGYLPLSTAGAEFCQVAVPARGADGSLIVATGFVRRRSDVSIGFLPYTFRNVYRQAFLLFGTRYGWRGMNGDRDSASFMKDIFRCFDIQLPQNPENQAQAFPAVISFEGMDRDTRLETVRGLPGGISLLSYDDHIMLYLGDVGGVPYAIHNIWAWVERNWNGPDFIHRSARVAVTDVMLGEGSSPGALIDRLKHATILGNYFISE